MNIRNPFLAIAITSLLFAACSQQKQQPGPLEATQIVFSQTDTADARQYCTRDYEGPTGKDLAAGAHPRFLLLQEDTATAVVNVTVIDDYGKGSDVYIYLRKEGVWKVEHIRGLAMTGIIEEVAADLEKLTPQQVDSMIAIYQKDTTHNYGFRSREEFDYELGNSKLTIALDDSIIAHLRRHQREFDLLRDAALQQLGGAIPDEERSPSLLKDRKADYRKLLISSVSTGCYGLGKCIDFCIGGMVDNTVGYIYVKDKKDLPLIDADRIIMIREIGNGWYMYKTT